ncbi:hypothetical protein L6452_16022 [Arctium lappa]|uniref:Uncharacterized protein n=1 Tax=Arctium lappa TaxID=4217 RepID=A0ACB9CQE0_ARCLA|nr:hypothetical protein L6452_16022 [Arctium lappa]
MLPRVPLPIQPLHHSPRLFAPSLLRQHLFLPTRRKSKQILNFEYRRVSIETFFNIKWKFIGLTKSTITSQLEKPFIDFALLSILHRV